MVEQWDHNPGVGGSSPFSAKNGFGGIGRHNRLKICFCLQSVGSSPIGRMMLASRSYLCLAGVTQLVRVSGCGSESRGFKSPYSPFIL